MAGRHRISRNNDGQLVPVLVVPWYNPRIFGLNIFRTVPEYKHVALQI